MNVLPTLRIEDVPSIGHIEAMALARSQNAIFLEELRALDPEDWDRPTACELWTVKDIASHLLGWAEGLTSPAEGARQLRAAIGMRKRFENFTDAQNQVQVEARSVLAPEVLIDRLQIALPRFLRLRDRVGRWGRVIPIYNALFGVANLRFVADFIFTRDLFMHRIDIARATGRTLNVGADERRLIHDIVREWAQRSGADCTLTLEGEADARLSCGSGTRAALSANTLDLCGLFAGRGSVDVVTIEGDARAALRWLEVGVRF